MKLYKKHGYKTSRVLLNIKSVVIALKMAITDFMLNTPYSAKHYVCSIIYIMLNNKYGKEKPVLLPAFVCIIVYILILVSNVAKCLTLLVYFGGIVAIFKLGIHGL